MQLLLITQNSIFSIHFFQYIVSEIFSIILYVHDREKIDKEKQRIKKDSIHV